MSCKLDPDLSSLDALQILKFRIGFVSFSSEPPAPCGVVWSWALSSPLVVWLSEHDLLLKVGNVWERIAHHGLSHRSLFKVTIIFHLSSLVYKETITFISNLCIFYMSLEQNCDFFTSMSELRLVVSYTNQLFSLKLKAFRTSILHKDVTFTSKSKVRTLLPTLWVLLMSRLATNRQGSSLVHTDITVSIVTSFLLLVKRCKFCEYASFQADIIASDFPPPVRTCRSTSLKHRFLIRRKEYST